MDFLTKNYSDVFIIIILSYCNKLLLEQAIAINICYHWVSNQNRGEGPNYILSQDKKL